MRHMSVPVRMALVVVTVINEVRCVGVGVCIVRSHIINFGLLLHYFKLNGGLHHSNMVHIMGRLVVVMDLVLWLRLVGLLLITVVLLRGLRTGLVTMTRVTLVIMPMTGGRIALLLIAIMLLFGGWCVVGSGIRIRMGRLLIPRLVFVLVGTLIA